MKHLPENVVLNNATKSDVFETSDAIEALQSLEQNTREAVVKQRGNDRLEVDIAVDVRPGNLSQRYQTCWTGVTGNVSETGCLVMTGVPLTPGDIYALSFDETTGIPSALAICLRSRMIRDDAFEAGMRFFDTIDLNIDEVLSGWTTV